MAKLDNKTLFSKVKPSKLFFKAAIPGSIGMLASSLYQLMDGVMVGQFLGDTAFAAVNLAMPFVIINFAIADLIGVGSSVPIAHALGRKADDEANNYFTSACIMIFAAGVALGAILFFLAEPLMRLMGAEGVLMEYAAEYLKVYALCSPVTTIVFATDNYLRISGKINYSLFVNILMSILCMGLEFLFLYVFRWGIWAAALGTAAGMMTAAVVSLTPFFLKKTPLRFVRPRFTRSMIKTTVSCGMPNFLNNVAARITSIFMNMMLLRFGGETAVSVYGVLMYAEGFVQPLMYGACDSLQPALGFNWGAGDYKRVKDIEKYCLAACMVVSVLSAVGLLVFPEQITALFMNSPDPAMTEMAVTAMTIFALTYFVRWISFAAQSFFLAIGRSLEATLLSVSVALVFPLILIGTFYPLELTGLWLNTPVTALLAGVLAVVLFILFIKRMRRQGPGALSSAVSPSETPSPAETDETAGVSPTSGNDETA